jgi:hypothetical protein
MADSAETAQMLQQIAMSLRTLAESSSQASRSLRDYTHEVDTVTEQLKDYEKGLTKGNKLSKEQERLAKEVVNAKKHELKIQENLNKAIRQAEIIQKSSSVSTGALAAATNQVTVLQQRHAQAQQQTALLTSAFGRSMSGLSGMFGKLSIITGKLLGPLQIAAGIVAFASDRLDVARDQMAANVGFVEDLQKNGSFYSAMLQQRAEAIKRGVDPQEAIMAAGGLTKSLEITDSVQRRFYALTGNLGDALQLSLEAMTEFTKLGVKPTQQALNRYVADVEQLSKFTGLSAREVKSLYDSVASDTDSLVLLKAAREDERESILANQRALVNMARAAGMTAQQASEAAKMLNRMVAAKPIERIKQAAKVRALAAAMGVGGGEEAGRAIIAGPQASPEQKQLLMEFNQQLTGVMDQARGQGLTAEIFATTLVDKLGLENVYGSNSAFSNTLGSAFREGDKLAAKQLSAADSTVIQLTEANDKLKVIAGNLTNIGEYLISDFATRFGQLFKWFTGSGFAKITDDLVLAKQMERQTAKNNEEARKNFATIQNKRETERAERLKNAVSDSTTADREAARYATATRMSQEPDATVKVLKSIDEKLESVVGNTKDTAEQNKKLTEVVKDNRSEAQQALDAGQRLADARDNTSAQRNVFGAGRGVYGRR